MIIATRALGTRKPLFEDFSVPLPPLPPNDPGDGGGGHTLRKLIERIVRIEVDRYNQRVDASRFVRALTQRQIDLGELRGKIDPGGRETPSKLADPDSAVHTALQAFQDGLYLVILDGQELRNLDTPLSLSDDSRVTFVRLVMLAGA
jgi:hypothetical protein